MCTEYTQSILDLKEACVRNNILLTVIFIGNESLVQRARNTITHVFLKTSADYLMFIDADQKFQANDIALMIKADKDIIGGPVPMKGINWESTKQTPKGEDPKYYSGYFNVNTLPGHKFVDMHTPVQVKHVGTGFMLIKQNVFKQLKNTVGWYMSGDEQVFDFFKVQNVNHELLSEDYHFCHVWRQSGGSVWLAPWCKIGHFGSYCFSGLFAHSDATIRT
jgi:hypothetical protein